MEPSQRTAWEVTIVTIMIMGTSLEITIITNTTSNQLNFVPSACHDKLIKIFSVLKAIKTVS